MEKCSLLLSVYAKKLKLSFQIKEVITYGYGWHSQVCWELHTPSLTPSMVHRLLPKTTITSYFFFRENSEVVS